MNGCALGLTLILLLGAPLAAGGLSLSPRELGTVMLRELTLQDGKVIIRVDSGGCTDKAAIQGSVRKEPGPTARCPHYVISFERVRVDDCKALLFDGTVLEYDLASDLGIAGVYTLTVTNGVFPRSMNAMAEENALKRKLVLATTRAIEMELRGYEGKLKTAQAGVGPAGNVEKFKSRIVELTGQQETFRKMNPSDYALATGPAEDSGAIFGQPGYGPVSPSRKQVVTVHVRGAYREGSLLEADQTSKSGPFFHLAGIAGNDFSRLKPGQTYELTVYPVYKREYIGLMADHYVYIADVK